MSIIHNSRPQVRNLLLLFIILNAIFISSMPFLPFIDLPNHLAEATIYKFYEPGNLLSQYYKPTPWYFPNTFHTVFCSLFPFVELGNKVFHILYIILLQGAVFLAIKQLKGNAWYGLLAILFTYNYNVTYGFVGFAISLPLLIILFYCILLDIHQDKILIKISIAFLLVVLFFMHAQNALLGLVLYGMMMVYHYRKSFKKILVHCLLVPLPLVMMIFTWWSMRDQEKEGSTLDYLKEYYSSRYLQNFITRARIVVFDNFQLQEGMSGVIIAAAFFLAVLFPLIWCRPWKTKQPAFAWSPEKIYAGIFFMIALGCYIVAPDQLPGQTPLFQRFCTIVMLAFILLSSIWLSKVHAPWLKYYTTIVCLVYTLFWFQYIYSFNRENRNFNKEFFAGLDNEGKLAGLIYDNDYRGRKVYIHYPNYFIIWNQGIAASKIIDYRFGVVRRVAPESALPFYQEMIGERYSFQPQYVDVDYLLVRGTAPVDPDKNLFRFSLWKHAAPWSLYKKAVNP